MSPDIHKRVQCMFGVGGIRRPAISTTAGGLIWRSAHCRQKQIVARTELARNCRSNVSPAGATADSHSSQGDDGVVTEVGLILGVCL